jgi:hypothetical protein
MHLFVYLGFNFHLEFRVWRIINLWVGLTKLGGVGEILAVYLLKSSSLGSKVKLKLPCSLASRSFLANFFCFMVKLIDKAVFRSLLWFFSNFCINKLIHLYSLNKPFSLILMYFHMNYNCFVDEFYHKTKKVCKKGTTILFVLSSVI